MRKIACAQDYDRFWQAMSLHFGIQDLLAEHDIPRALAASIELFAMRQAREIADPDGLGAGMRVVVRLLPPQRFLPKPLPAALAETFGAELAAAISTSHAAQLEYKP